MNDEHALVEVEIRSPTLATYRCACGAVGRATAAAHLGGLDKMGAKAKINHELHSARAYRRKLIKTP